MAETRSAAVDTSRAAVEKLIADVCGALDDQDAAVTVCESPDCSAIQCRLNRAVRALLDEREALQRQLLNAASLFTVAPRCGECHACRGIHCMIPHPGHSCAGRYILRDSEDSNGQ